MILQTQLQPISFTNELRPLRMINTFLYERVASLIRKTPISFMNELLQFITPISFTTIFYANFLYERVAPISFTNDLLL